MKNAIIEGFGTALFAFGLGLAATAGIVTATKFVGPINIKVNKD